MTDWGTQPLRRHRTLHRKPTVSYATMGKLNNPALLPVQIATGLEMCYTKGGSFYAIFSIRGPIHLHAH